MLLGNTSGSHSDFAYGGVTLYAETFQVSSAIQMISYSLPDQQLRLVSPSTPVTQRLLAITRNRLACSLFAHHYSGNRGCFLFLRVLRCFTSPRYLHLPYVFRQG